MENWKSIENYPNYEISDLGNVKNKYGRILNIRLTSTGYNRVRLYNDYGAKNFSVHRLVAIAFITNPNNYEEINHKDRNKLNNKVTNLEWVTHLENMQHRFKDHKGIEIVLVKDNVEYSFKSLADASRFTGSDQSSLAKLNKGILKSTSGFKKKGGK